MGAEHFLACGAAGLNQANRVLSEQGAKEFERGRISMLPLGSKRGREIDHTPTLHNISPGVL